MAEKKILIADFDKKNLENLTSLFISANLGVSIAIDGQEAFEKFESEKPDLLLLEPMLPKLHGFDIIKKIRKELGKSTPIVVLTGIYKGTRNKNEALGSLGVSAFLEKPFDSEQLKAIVVNLIHGEDHIDEDLPDPESIENILAELAEKSGEAPPEK